MGMPVFSDAAELEQFRPYLMAVVRANVCTGTGDLLDLSGIVQQTFLEAYRQWEQLRGRPAAELLRRLRRMLANNLSDAVRRSTALKRDFGRRLSLDQVEDALAVSSIRLSGLMLTAAASPSDLAQREDRAALVAVALAELTDAQREALILHYWDGMTLAEIGVRLQRTPVAVAGLLKRGLKELRVRLHRHQTRGAL
jgi:RNA polymerase sigma-70 factor, ECF subfamily